MKSRQRTPGELEALRAEVEAWAQSPDAARDMALIAERAKLNAAPFVRSRYVDPALLRIPMSR